MSKKKTIAKKKPVKKVAKKKTVAKKSKAKPVKKKAVVAKKKTPAKKKAAATKKKAAATKKKAAPTKKKAAATKKKAAAAKKKVSAVKKAAPAKKKAVAAKKASIKKVAVKASASKASSKVAAKKAKSQPSTVSKAKAKPQKKAVNSPAGSYTPIKRKANAKVIDFSELMPSAKSTAGPLEFEPYPNDRSHEEYMCESHLAHFRDILTNWKVSLMQEVDATVGHLKKDKVTYADPLDRAAQEEEFNLELRTRDRERKLIKKIEQALDWIEQGVYGYCEDCGADIGIRRLEARPTADKCIDCKTFDEIREKQIGGN